MSKNKKGGGGITSHAVHMGGAKAVINVIRKRKCRYLYQQQNWWPHILF